MSSMSTQTPISYKTIAAVTIAMLSWSSSFVFIRFCLHDYSPGSLALFRYLIVSAVMALFYWRIPNKKLPTKKNAIALFFLGFFGIGLYMIALNYGEITVSAAITSFLIGMNPIVSMIWAAIFFKERITWIRALGVVVSIIGLSIIAFAKFQDGTIGIGILVIIFAVICAGIYNVGQKPLLKEMHPIEVAAITAWVGTAVMLIFTPDMLKEIPHASWAATGSVIYLGVIPGAIGYAAWSYAVSGAKSAARLSLVLYVLPLLTTLLGWLMLGEIPSLFALFGGFVALMGALIATRS